MANVTVSITPTSRFRTWATPQPTRDQPRGEVIFHEADRTIIAKGAADEQLVSMSMALPRNFMYQLVEALIIGTVPAEADAVDLSKVWLCRTSSPRLPFVMPMDITPLGGFGSTFERTWPLTFTSSTLDLGVTWRPRALPGEFFGPGGGAGLLGDQPGLTCFNVDVTADATPAWSMEVYFRFLQYTVEQFNESWIHRTPTSIGLGVGA